MGRRLSGDLWGDLMTTSVKYTPISVTSQLFITLRITNLNTFQCEEYDWICKGAESWTHPGGMWFNCPARHTECSCPSRGFTGGSMELHLSLFQRLGCIHGEELAYVFGAPMVNGFSPFPSNFTKMEVVLSEIVMTLWSNFVKSGNPNEPTMIEDVVVSKQDRNKIRNVKWEPYEKIHKKYLDIGLKPRQKSHYRAHKLSFWLYLVPELHKPGDETVPSSHHLLSDHDNLDLYGGVVKTLVFTPSLPTSTTPNPPPVSGEPIIPSSKIDLYPDSVTAPSDPIWFHDVTSSHSPFIRSGNQQNKPVQDENLRIYTTALSVTIAIGCSLLILNILIFAGVYYQRDKHRMEMKRRKGSGKMPLSISGKTDYIEPNTPKDPCEKQYQQTRKLSISSSPSPHITPTSFTDVHLSAVLPRDCTLPRMRDNPNRIRDSTCSLPRKGKCNLRETMVSVAESQPLLTQGMHIIPTNVPGPPKGKIPNSVQDIRV